MVQATIIKSFTAKASTILVSKPLEKQQLTCVQARKNTYRYSRLGSSLKQSLPRFSILLFWSHLGD